PAIMKANDAVAPGRRRRWGRAILASGQVAVSVVLLVVAMFMYRGFRQQLADGPGYRTDHLMMMGFDTSLIRYTDAQSRQFFQDVAERARALPAVKGVTMTTSIPMLNNTLGGVAKTSKYIFIAEPPTDFLYLPYRQNASPAMTLVAESTGDPAALSAPLREAVRGLDVNMPIFNVRTMERLYQMRATSIFNVLV